MEISKSLIGARLNNKQSTIKIDSTDLANSTPAISLISLDFPTGKKELINQIRPKTINEVLPTTVDNTDTKTEIANLAAYTQPIERLTSLTTLSDDRLVFVTTVSTQKGHHNNLLFFDGKSSKSKKVSGFKKCNCTVENLLAIAGDKLIAVVSLAGGIPPFELVEIDLKNGKVTSDSDLGLPQLPPNIRLSNLTLGHDGKIYATTLGMEGVTRLVQLDLDNRSMVTGKGKIVSLSPLTFDKKFLQQDLLSLTFSPSGEVYALANPQYEEANCLFSVDMNAGKMTLLSKAEVDKITFSKKKDK
ncbi:MAG: hypothetical protein RMY28_030390 [Nostoc sp. ChiSLP01]|nr:hypothetical protein [Nostoc sp. CmiSLP01]MDZ8283592.1 hypothetical protein [Nostoc sp. ChiSLP01]